jgi:alkylhydroperoxidase/carboxymuconolactone decarboxylase family protein YurZ
VAKAKRAGLSDEELREAVKRVVPINLGALFMSVIGLMMVILGVFLG